MCSLNLPPKILEHIDKIRRHCLWVKKKDDGEESHYSLAAWDLVCRPKKKGGLGVLNLKIQNEGLLLKYLHKFYNKTDTPWVQLLWNTYYTGKVPHALDPCGSLWWRDVFKLSPIYRGIAVSSTSDGSCNLFWKDLWKDNIIAPRAFSFTTDEDVSVQQFLNSGRLANNFHFPLSTEAFHELTKLQLQCADVFMTETSDSWTYCWGSSSFSSRQYYKFCFRNVEPHASFLWLCKSKCTPRIKFVGWLLLLDRLNTRNMLKRRQMVIDSGFNCLMCTSPPEETLEHMLFFCPFRMQCWDSL
jgi:hypothetical protein